MKRILCIILMFSTVVAFAQPDRKDVRRGNRKFRSGDFRNSEIDYRRAVVKDSLSVPAEYNLSSALYRQGKYDEAGKALETVKDVAPAGKHAARYWYNSGDVALQKKDYGAAVKAFREALLLEPGDLDAKENYIYAKMMLRNQEGGGGEEQQEQQDQQDQQNQDRNQQQNQDQQQDREEDQNQQDQQPQISPQQAQQMLQAIQARERETQDKVNKEKAAALKSRQKEKNW